jgi:hypothetical protein
MASRVFHIELLGWIEVSGNTPEMRRILIWNWDIFDDNQKERCYSGLPGSVIDRGVGVQAVNHLGRLRPRYM